MWTSHRCLMACHNRIAPGGKKTPAVKAFKGDSESWRDLKAGRGGRFQSGRHSNELNKLQISQAGKKAHSQRNTISKLSGCMLTSLNGEHLLYISTKFVGTTDLLAEKVIRCMYILRREVEAHPLYRRKLIVNSLICRLSWLIFILSACQWELAKYDPRICHITFLSQSLPMLLGYLMIAKKGVS